MTSDAVPLADETLIAFVDRVVQPNERITPKFASSIVNRLFSVGLALAGTRSLLEGGVALEHIEAAVDQLDEQIRDIRLAVFSSDRRAAPPGGSSPPETCSFVCVPHLQLDVAPSATSVLVRASGELDLAAAARFAETLGELIERGERDVVVDCSRLSFADAAGVRAIEQVGKRLQELGGRLRLRRPSRALRRVCELIEEGRPPPPWTIEG